MKPDNLQQALLKLSDGSYLHLEFRSAYETAPSHTVYHGEDREMCLSVDDAHVIWSTSNLKLIQQISAQTTTVTVRLS